MYFDNLTITHTGLQVVEQTDYYPYGMVMRKETPSQGQGIYNPYRHGYQGQFAEKDEETGWNHFKLRQYGSRIGRWTATDPYRQYASPYKSMGNNPISRTDPDGGFDCDDCKELNPNPIQDDYVNFGYGDDIASYIYNNGDWERLRIGGFLNDVVVTPNGWDKNLDFGSFALKDAINSGLFVVSATTMPIINQFGGGNVDWAKIYTFNENWEFKGRNLDDGNLSVEEMNEVMHHTVGFLSLFAPAATVIKTANPVVNKVGNEIITNVATEVAQKVIDQSIGYHK